jgi:predicted amidohydrolase
MARQITIAAIQMFADDSLIEERLERAEKLIIEAAQKGAQLVVLPEMFNTGYGYFETNYENAETIDGHTVTWMKEIAATHSLHLAGTLYIRDKEDIYNAMLLIAPDGRLWRYNKNYPWLWERAYYREGNTITIADTKLGKLGMMVCWDVAHVDQWKRYAGKVDAMIISSCPPAMHDHTWVFHDGNRVKSEDMNFIMEDIKRRSDQIFGLYLRQQSVNLGIPVVNTTGTGKLSTPLPLPSLSLMVMSALRPDLWKYIPRAGDVRLETNYFQETYIATGDGRVLGKVDPETEGYTLATVTLADEPPSLRRKQPRFGIPLTAYMLDMVGNVMFTPIYREGVRRLHGQSISPLGIGNRVASTVSELTTSIVGFLRRDDKRKSKTSQNKSKKPVPIK